MATVILSRIPNVPEPQAWHLQAPTPLLILAGQVYRCVAHASNGPEGDENVYFYEPADQCE